MRPEHRNLGVVRDGGWQENEVGLIELRGQQPSCGSSTIPART